MKAEESALGNAEDEPFPPTTLCSDCGQSYKTPQGLAGHRRLAHSTSTAQALDEQRRALESKSAEVARKDEAARKKEVEVARRRREIDSTGPSSIGLAQCEDCEAWFGDSDKLRSHTEAVHPIDQKVAAEVGVSTSRVNDVWTEACNKQKRHANETPEEIVKRFWSGTDQRILRSLLDHNASFEFEEE